MSPPDPEAMARILADPATAARMMADPATAARIMADPVFTALCRAPWHPDPGNAPQVHAYTSPADLVLYGGAAGGGKSDLLLGLALTAHERSVIFRRAYADLSGLTQRLLKILPDRRGYVASPHPRLERDGRLIEFGALEKPGSEQDWQGRPHDFIGFDEGAQLAEDKVRFVMGWRRSTTPDQRCRVVIASNPPVGGEGGWLLSWFAPWLDPVFPHPAKPLELCWCCTRADGTIAWVDGPGMHMIDGARLAALSCTFIPARLEDNRFLRDTDYRTQLMSLPEPLRSKLLHGDFLTGRADAPSQVIPWSWIEGAQKDWTPDGARGLKMTTLGVDVAQGGADETVLGVLYGTWYGPLVRRKGIDTTNGPAVAGLVIEVMRDRCQINIDLTGGWGGSARDHLAGAGHPGRAGGVLARLARANEGRAAHLRQQALGAVVEVPRSARSGAGRRHHAATRPAARRAARGADLAAARQRDPDREQGRYPQAARHVDRRCGRRDPRLAQARRCAAPADQAQAGAGAVHGPRRMDGDMSARRLSRCVT